MDRGGWQATVHRFTESDMTEVTEHTSTVCPPVLRIKWYRHKTDIQINAIESRIQKPIFIFIVN